MPEPDRNLPKYVRNGLALGIIAIALGIIGFVVKDGIVYSYDYQTTTTSSYFEDSYEATTSFTNSSVETHYPSLVGAYLTENAEGDLVLMNDGSVINFFTGIFTNDEGGWYVENGVVNFHFTGKVFFGGITYDIENGKVVG